MLLIEYGVIAPLEGVSGKLAAAALSELVISIVLLVQVAGMLSTQSIVNRVLKV